MKRELKNPVLFSVRNVFSPEIKIQMLFKKFLYLSILVNKTIPYL